MFKFFLDNNYEGNGILDLNVDQVWIVIKVTLPKCTDIYFVYPNVEPKCEFSINKLMFGVSHGSVVVSKHGLYMGGPGSIPTAVTIMTAAGGDAEHVSLNHWLAPPYQGVKLGLAKT